MLDITAVEVFASFESEVKPILSKYCVKCHSGGKKTKGDVDLSTATAENLPLRHSDHADRNWQRSGRPVDGYKGEGTEVSVRCQTRQRPGLIRLPRTWSPKSVSGDSRAPVSVRQLSHENVAGSTE
jgi:hypothetical protein